MKRHWIVGIWMLLLLFLCNSFHGGVTEEEMDFGILYDVKSSNETLANYNVTASWAKALTKQLKKQCYSYDGTYIYPVDVTSYNGSQDKNKEIVKWYFDMTDPESITVEKYNEGIRKFTYYFKPVKVAEILSLNGTVQTDDTLSGNEYKFALYDANNNKVFSETQNDLNGNISFNFRLNREDFFKEGEDDDPPGEVTYTIRQIANEGGQKLVLKDPKNVKIKVSLSAERNFYAEIIEGDNFEFVPEAGDTGNLSEMEASFDLLCHVKYEGFILKNGKLVQPEMERFALQLSEQTAEERKVIKTQECDSDGNVHFELSLTDSDVGMHKYFIEQIALGNSKIRQENVVHAFNMNVTKDSVTGELNAEPIYIGSLEASVTRNPVDLSEVIFRNEVESKRIELNLEQEGNAELTWTLFANGIEVDASEVLDSILQVEEDRMIIRSLPKYDENGDEIEWSVQATAENAQVEVLSPDGRPRTNGRAYSGDTVHMSMNVIQKQMIHSGISFQVNVKWFGDNGFHPNDLKVVLLKNGQNSNHSIRQAIASLNHYIFRAEDLGGGNYTAIVQPPAGYLFRYLMNGMEVFGGIGNGGTIELIKIPDTGDSIDPYFLVLILGTAVTIIIALVRAKRNEHN